MKITLAGIALCAPSIFASYLRKENDCNLQSYNDGTSSWSLKYLSRMAQDQSTFRSRGRQDDRYFEGYDNYDPLEFDGLYDFTSGEITKKNLLKRNFKILVDILTRTTGGPRRDEHRGRSHHNEEFVSRRLYEIFHECLYLIDSCEYRRYKIAFDRKNFVRCYYIIVTCIDPLKVAFEYTETVNQLCEDGFLEEKYYYYNSKDRVVRSCEVIKSCTTKICSADFLFEPKNIIYLNLPERIHLIRFFFDKYYCETNRQPSNYEIAAFIKHYEYIYLRGREIDHQVACFILYRLFGQLSFERIELRLIFDTTRWMEDYIHGRNIERARFFCRLLYGTCGK